ncbi:hypothetical protein BA173_02220 [Rickettsia sp. MEAM1 (Bemisia tabaci)]|nr:hypothetical protein BA173_02220 [Rickettsia sp. MEAM1 (Bemisia tabaci)]ODA37689.1 hypothetical protein A8V33_01625 [Rickettsia sp. wb]ODA37866.1 hypothetical protein A8V34_02515 [Rickettsia sp. wq]
MKQLRHCRFNGLWLLVVVSLKNRLSYATAMRGVIQKNNKKCYKLAFFTALLRQNFQFFLAMTFIIHEASS